MKAGRDLRPSWKKSDASYGAAGGKAQTYMTIRFGLPSYRLVPPWLDDTISHVYVLILLSLGAILHEILHIKHKGSSMELYSILLRRCIIASCYEPAIPRMTKYVWGNQ